MSEGEKPKSNTISLPFIESTAKLFEPTLWLTYTFAPEWLQDAREEIKDFNSAARRRELVFAVSFIEAYLIEWVRDSVLNRDFRQLSDCFPKDAKVGIRDKWKNVLKTLKRDGLLKEIPNFSDNQVWREFCLVVRYRNGVVHGASSRPETSDLEEGLKPEPSKGDLNNIQPGWATEKCVDLVKQLHQVTGTQLPDWI